MAQQPAEWQILRSPGFSKGLNLIDAPELLDPSELTEAKNVQFLAGYLRSVPGYAAFADTFVGTAQIIIFVTFTDATEELLMLTTAALYKLVGTQWQFVSDGTATTLAAAAVVTDTFVDVNSATGFSAGEYVGLTLDDATQHKTTIASISVGGGAGGSDRVNLDDAVAGDGAAISNAFVRAANLSGSIDIPADVAALYDINDVAFTNGVDKVKVYDRSTIANISNLPSGGNTLCRALAVWNQRLFLGRTTEGGTSFPQRNRWCAVGDITDWSGADAGFVDLWDREDAIQSLLVFSDFLVIMREQMITKATYVGQTDRLAVYQPSVTREGIFSSKVTAVGSDRLIFLGRANVYEYRGIPSLKPLGRNIARNLLSTSGALDPTKHNRAFHLYVQEAQDLLFFVPTTNNNNPKVAYRLDLDMGGWSIREYANNFTCAATYKQSTQLTWDQAPGDWDDYPQDWSSREFNTNSETLLLAGSDGQVYETDFVQVDDAGTAIPFAFATKDWLFDNAEVRVQKIEFLYSGPALLVEYSTTGGFSWLEYGTTSAQAIRGFVRLHKDVQGERIRFRFSADGGTFTFGYFLITAQPAVPHN